VNLDEIADAFREEAQERLDDMVAALLALERGAPFGEVIDALFRDAHSIKGGAGMMGAAVHRAVLEAGDAATGVTVHEVTLELDAGPILAQVPVPVHAGDNVETLAARVLAEEHRLLVETIRSLSDR